MSPTGCRMVSARRKLYIWVQSAVLMRKIFLSVIILICSSAAGRAQDSLYDGPSETCVGLNFSRKTPPSGRYLFEPAWVKAEFITPDNRYLRNDSILYNFDKVSQELYLTLDKNTAFKVDRREFKSVTLFFHDESYTFEHLYSINKTDLFQVMIKNPRRYSLYKRVRTRIINGSFEDYYSYFLLPSNGPVARIYSLSIRSVNRAFALGPDSQKANEFCMLYCKNGLDEDYLKRLVNYLNDQPETAGR
jgi:hypothetical protein